MSSDITFLLPFGAIIGIRSPPILGELSFRFFYVPLGFTFEVEEKYTLIFHVMNF